MATLELIQRPLRPSDRRRVLEISAGVWDGHDYLPEVFDEWVQDPGANFQGVELEGVVVGIQRLRPIAPGILFMEGMRVDAALQGRGIGSEMARMAIAGAREQDFRELRLVTANPVAVHLFESLGFALISSLQSWVAPRSEEGELERLPDESQLAGIWEGLADDPDAADYGGVNADWQAPLDLGLDLLRSLQTEGRVRVSGAGRALALVGDEGRERLRVTHLSGSAAPLQHLLSDLRFEADAHDLVGVSLLLPAEHRARQALEHVGYDLANDPAWRLRFYRLSL